MTSYPKLLGLCLVGWLCIGGLGCSSSEDETVRRERNNPAQTAPLESQESSEQSPATGQSPTTGQSPAAEQSPPPTPQPQTPSQP
jgi:hypothetical protein